MLEIKNLHVKLEDDDKQILKGVDLTVEAGKVHAVRHDAGLGEGGHGGGGDRADGGDHVGSPQQGPQHGARRPVGALHHRAGVGVDNIDVAGMVTTAGSRILANNMANRDAFIAARLKRAGAVIVGKANLHEWVFGPTSQSTHYGPVRNPWDTSRIPGGSSGGSGASLAAGMCVGSIGSDTGGSIRLPAAFCGGFGQ